MPSLSFSSFNELQIIKFFLFYLGGNQQVSRHVSDRADRDPPTQPHERDSPFPVRGEEGSLLSHPHLCPSGHAGKTMLALFPFCQSPKDSPTLRILLLVYSISQAPETQICKNFADIFIR